MTYGPVDVAPGLHRGLEQRVDLVAVWVAVWVAVVRGSVWYGIQVVLSTNLGVYEVVDR